MNYYEILKVKPTDDIETIKESYKTLIKKYHPDIYTGDKLYAEKMTKELNAAYEVLSNPEKRNEYDMELFENSNSSNYTETQSYEGTNYRSKSFDNEDYYKNFYKTTTSNSYYSYNESDSDNRDAEQKMYDDYMRNYNERHNIKSDQNDSENVKNYEEQKYLKIFIIFVFIILIGLLFTFLHIYIINKSNNKPSEDIDTSDGQYYQNPNYEYHKGNERPYRRDSDSFYKNELLKKFDNRQLYSLYEDYLSTYNLTKKDIAFPDFLKKLYDTLKKDGEI